MTRPLVAAEALGAKIKVRNDPKANSNPIYSLTLYIFLKIYRRKAVL
jgi:hypothetical protein